MQETGWLNMKNRGILYSATIYQKIYLIKKPPYLFEKLKFRTEVHNLNLRHKGFLSPPIFKKELFRRSFSYQIYKFYNELYNLYKI